MEKHLNKQMEELLKSRFGPVILILGGGIQQTRCIKRCKKLGFITCCFDKNENCFGSEAADLFFQISIKNHNEILSIVASIKNVVAVLAPATDIGNITACRIASKLGLLYNSEEVVNATCNKSLMREKINSLGLANPKYFTVTDQVKDELDLYSSNKSSIFPCIVKPVDSSAGRGITICNKSDKLKEAVSYALKESQEALVIVEKIIQGPQFSLETLSFNGEHMVIAIAAQTMDLNEKHVEVGHILPAPIPKKIHSMLVEYAIGLLNGFGIQFGACHIEVRIVDKSIYTLDFASRMGGWRDIMIESIIGEVYIDAFIKSHLTEEERTKKFSARYDSVLEPQFCVARMAFDLEDLHLLNDLERDGVCEYESVNREVLNIKNDNIKRCLSDSAGHFLYKSDFSKENSIVAKYNCVDLTKDFVELI